MSKDKKDSYRNKRSYCCAFIGCSQRVSLARPVRSDEKVFCNSHYILHPGQAQELGMRDALQDDSQANFERCHPKVQKAYMTGFLRAKDHALDLQSQDPKRALDQWDRDLSLLLSSGST